MPDHPLSFDEVASCVDELHTQYYATVQAIAQMQCYAIALEVVEEVPNCAYIGTSTSDQDYDGGQCFDSFFDEDMGLIGDNDLVEDTGRALDLDNKTQIVWMQFLADENATLAKQLRVDNVFEVAKIFAALDEECPLVPDVSDG